MRRAGRLLLSAAIVVAGIAACAPRLMAVGDPVYNARLDIVAASTTAIMADGASLPMRVFLADEPHAAVVALHGFNDYSNAFSEPGPGPWLAERGIVVYAIDQRGFGRAPGRGLWAGDNRMAEDAASVVKLVRTRHPDLPVYLLGVSMGGAVAMRTMMLPEPPEIDGLILAAPAVWGWRVMNDFYSVVLWASAHIAPSYTLTGRGLEIMPSDNIEMLRALGRDPLVIKETRIDTIYGLVNLMDSAYAVAPDLGVPVLLLYGANDRIVPAPPLADALAAMRSGAAPVTALCYPEGWHMLLRDLQREAVWRDITAWISGDAIVSGHADLQPCGALAGG
ncbi:MAG: lysophospholipase [Parvibaculum sp.]|uniref:lysophospholipase n=1 Tax=Parvibaculum sp. TaxID=2024848 RepID=UPI0034A01A2F